VGPLGRLDLLDGLDVSQPGLFRDEEGAVGLKFFCPLCGFVEFLAKGGQ